MAPELEPPLRGGLHAFVGHVQSALDDFAVQNACLHQQMAGCCAWKSLIPSLHATFAALRRAQAAAPPGPVTSSPARSNRARDRQSPMLSTRLTHWSACPPATGKCFICVRILDSASSRMTFL